MRLRAKQIEETRAALMDSGRALFAAKGYKATSAQEIVEDAGLTRGALYHHFPTGKEGLFEAVHRSLQREVMESVLATPNDDSDDLDQGVSAYLDAATRPDYRQIVLSDGPAVFGWQKWHEMEANYAMSIVADGVMDLPADHPAHGLDLPMLSNILFGAYGEAAMAIAASDDPIKAKEKALAIFQTMFR
jgi:AcrR family transcriptional regulator